MKDIFNKGYEIVRDNETIFLTPFEVADLYRYFEALEGAGELQWLLNYYPNELSDIEKEKISKLCESEDIQTLQEVYWTAYDALVGNSDSEIYKESIKNQKRNIKDYLKKL